MSNSKVYKKIINSLEDERVKIDNNLEFDALMLDIQKIVSNITHDEILIESHEKEDCHLVNKIKEIQRQLKFNDSFYLNEELLEILLSGLRSSNGNIRDKLAYPILERIITTGKLNEDNIRFLYNELITDKYVFNSINSPKNDQIYNRSFSILVLADLIHADESIYHFFSKDELNTIAIVGLSYALLEADGRGFVDSFGWAHARTHIVRLFHEVNNSKMIGMGYKKLFFGNLLFSYYLQKDSLAFGEAADHANEIIQVIKDNQDFEGIFLAMARALQETIQMMNLENTTSFWNMWFNRNRLLQALFSNGDLPSSAKEELRKVNDVILNKLT